MKRIAAVLAAVAIAFVLAGCSSSTSDPNSDDWEFRSVNTPDGRSVPCVMYEPGTNWGLMSCDWANAKAIK